MNNGEILKYCQFVCNKEQTGNSISPIEFTEILSVCSLKQAKRKLGIAEIPDGSPIKQEFEKNQNSTDSLSRLKKWMGAPNTMPLTIDSNGIAVLPSDYLYHSSILYKQATNNTDCSVSFKYRTVEVTTDQQFDEILSHPIRPPSLKYPICNYQSNIIRFAPSELKFVDFIYIRKPIDPVYDFYISANGEYIYFLPNTTHTLLAGEESSSGVTSGIIVSQSVELEWDEISKLDICALILQHIGINLREGALMQYSEMIKEKGV